MRDLAKAIEAVEALPGFECWTISHDADSYRIGCYLPYWAELHLRNRQTRFLVYGHSEVEALQGVLDAAQKWLEKKE